MNDTEKIKCKWCDFTVNRWTRRIGNNRSINWYEILRTHATLHHPDEYNNVIVFSKGKKDNEEEAD